MNNSNFGRWMAEIIAALLILLFVYTSVSKIAQFSSFRLVLSGSPLVGAISPVLSVLVPAVELVISIMLSIPMWRQYGLLASTLLMIVFTLYIAYMLLLTPHLPCSCGGAIERLGWRGHLVFNLLVSGLAYWGWRLELRNKRTIAIGPVANQA